MNSMRIFNQEPQSLVGGIPSVDWTFMESQTWFHKDGSSINYQMYHIPKTETRLPQYALICNKGNRCVFIFQISEHCCIRTGGEESETPIIRLEDLMEMSNQKVDTAVKGNMQNIGKLHSKTLFVGVLVGVLLSAYVCTKQGGGLGTIPNLIANKYRSIS